MTAYHTATSKNSDATTFLRTEWLHCSNTSYACDYFEQFGSVWVTTLAGSLALRFSAFLLRSFLLFITTTSSSGETSALALSDSRRDIETIYNSSVSLNQILLLRYQTAISQGRVRNGLYYRSCGLLLTCKIQVLTAIGSGCHAWVVLACCLMGSTLVRFVNVIRRFGLVCGMTLTFFQNYWSFNRLGTSLATRASC